MLCWTILFHHLEALVALLQLKIDPCLNHSGCPGDTRHGSRHHWAAEEFWSDADGRRRGSDFARFER